MSEFLEIMQLSCLFMLSCKQNHQSFLSIRPENHLKSQKYPETQMTVLLLRVLQVTLHGEDPPVLHVHVLLLDLVLVLALWGGRPHLVVRRLDGSEG